MCLGCCCDALYSCRGCFWKLVTPLWIIDLILTIYLVIAFYQSNIYACCTSNLPAVEDVCRYEDLGGSANVYVDDNGYCKRYDNDLVSCTDTGICAESFNIVTDPFGDVMCSPEVLDDVASCNWFWLTAILITKAGGLTILIILDFVSCCKKVNAGEEEAKQTQTCMKCKQWGKSCCLSTLKLIFKLLFLIFGTIATLCAIYYLELTGHVLKSSCSCVSSELQNICNETSEVCNGADNYYAVVFDNVDLAGPYWFDFVSNILSTVIWIIRIIVMRHALKKTHLADV